jgi:SAM-dependent methyltransferase
MDFRERAADVRDLSRQFGPAYAAADLGRRVSRRLAHRLEDTLLDIEGSRGVLGPAHRMWSDNSTSENRRRWNEWDWSTRGEEWNESEAWKNELVERVMLQLIPPGGTVLEIGPGAGRWSEFLAPRADRLILVDVAQKPLELVAERLSGHANVDYVLSDGASLPGVDDQSVDAVWSFDVFVHIRPRDQAAYLADIARVLRPGGIAAIHHSDGRNRGRAPSREGWRSPMTARLFAALAAEHGLAAEREVREWSDARHDLGAFHDVISVLRQPQAGGNGRAASVAAAGGAAAGESGRPH